MPQYTRPPTFATGQILGRANVGVLRDNDDFFNALADRYRVVAAGRYTGWVTDRALWNGYHMLESDALTLHYSMTVTSAHLPEPITLRLYYNYGGGAAEVEIDAIGGNDTVTDTYDLTAFHTSYGAGLYRVTCMMEQPDDNYGGTGICRAPYTVYTGAKSYAAGTAISDGNVGTAAHLNKWRDNDLFFNDVWPRQVANSGLAVPWAGSGGTELEVWDGWDKWHPDHSRLHYKVSLSSNAGDNELRIYYDWDNIVNQQYDDINAEGTTTGYIDISGAFVKGDYYRLRVVKQRTDQGKESIGEAHYIYMAPDGADASYTVMDDFAVDQYVYGDTAAQLTRLNYLTDNDAAIYDRLCWNSSTEERRTFACLEPNRDRSAGGNLTGVFALKRYGDTLHYRTEGGTLTKPDGTTESLTDYGASDYQTLDLNTIDLPYGGHYTIAGNTLHFAMEV